MVGLVIYEVAGTAQFHEGADWCDAYRTVMDSVVSGVRCVELFLERSGGYLRDGVVHYHYTVPLYTIRAWVEAHSWERAQDFIRACLHSYCSSAPCGVSTQRITCSSGVRNGRQ